MPRGALGAPGSAVELPKAAEDEHRSLERWTTRRLSRRRASNVVADRKLNPIKDAGSFLIQDGLKRLEEEEEAVMKSMLGAAKTTDMDVLTDDGSGYVVNILSPESAAEDSDSSPVAGMSRQASAVVAPPCAPPQSSDVVGRERRAESDALRAKLKAATALTEARGAQLKAAQAIIDNKDRQTALVLSREDAQRKKWQARMLDLTTKLQDQSDRLDDERFKLRKKERECRSLQEDMAFRAKNEAVRLLRKVREFCRNCPGLDSRKLQDFMREMESSELGELGLSAGAVDKDDTIAENLRLVREVEDMQDQIKQLEVRGGSHIRRLAEAAERAQQMQAELDVSIPAISVMPLKRMASQIRDIQIETFGLAREVLAGGAFTEFAEVFAAAIAAREEELRRQLASTMSVLTKRTEELATARAEMRELLAVGVLVDTAARTHLERFTLPAHSGDAGQIERDLDGAPKPDSVSASLQVHAKAMAEMATIYAQMVAECERQKAAAETLRSELLASKREVESARQQIAEERKRGHEKQEEINRLLCREAALEEDLMRVEGVLRDTEAELEEAKKDLGNIPEMKARIVELEAENADLKHKLNDTQEKLFKKMRECDLLRDEVQELKRLAAEPPKLSLRTAPPLTKIREREEWMNAVANHLSELMADMLPGAAEASKTASAARRTIAHRVLKQLGQGLKQVGEQSGDAAFQSGWTGEKKISVATQCIREIEDPMLPGKDLAMLPITVVGAVATVVCQKTIRAFAWRRERWKQRYTELRDRRQSDLVKLSQLLQLEYSSAEAVRNATLSFTAAAKLRTLHELMEAPAPADAEQRFAGMSGIQYSHMCPPELIFYEDGALVHGSGEGTARREPPSPQTSPRPACGLPLPSSHGSLTAVFRGGRCGGGGGLRTDRSGDSPRPSSRTAGLSSPRRPSSRATGPSAAGAPALPFIPPPGSSFSALSPDDPRSQHPGTALAASCGALMPLPRGGRVEPLPHDRQPGTSVRRRGPIGQGATPASPDAEGGEAEEEEEQRRAPPLDARGAPAPTGPRPGSPDAKQQQQAAGRNRPPRKPRDPLAWSTGPSGGDEGDGGKARRSLGKRPAKKQLHTRRQSLDGSAAADTAPISPPEQAVAAPVTVHL